MSAGQRDGERERITLVREYEATLEEVWELWTTAEGIEAWWGPDGFGVEVRRLDLRVGGELHYAMVARAPEAIAFLQREGMPVVQECRITFTAVEPPRRLEYIHLADFIPGVAAYDVGTRVELEPVGGRVRLSLTLDRMHDDLWTGRATAGWELELRRLATALASRAAAPRTGGP